MHKRTVLGFIAGVIFTISIPAIAQTIQSSFSDVGSSSLFSAAVSRMSGLGVIRGYDDGRFGPNDTVTRGQVAVMFDRYDQTVVDPLRQELHTINTKLGLVCGSHTVGENYPSADGCNSCSCTEKGEICTLRACLSSSSSSSSSNQCKQYNCNDGTVVPSCSADGHVINYFVAPCMLHGGDRSSASSTPKCGNGICETGENSSCATCPVGQLCPMYCLAGTCPRDCTLSSSSTNGL